MVDANPQMIAYFSALIEKEMGIQYRDTNAHLLANRIHDLVRLLSYADVESFWKEVQTTGLRPAAKTMILDLATNNETSFFRDADLFEYFKTTFVPQAKPIGGTLRIWSAACSTGQEPYTLAMIMAQLRESGLNVPYQIVATDFSERVLAQASAGRYSQLEVQRGLPAPLLIKYFEQQSQEGTSLPVFVVKPELKRSITFKRLNLLEPWLNWGPFDIVFCRNVLIYQGVDNKRQVISRIADVLAPDGTLVLGGAESLLGLSSEFELKQFGKTCVYRLKADRQRTSA